MARQMISPSYAAGFFDGEGSVYVAVRKRRNGWNPSPTLLICISNNHLGVLEKFRERWGGSINPRKRRPRQQQQYQWVLAPRNALKFMKDVGPFLIVKAEVARLGIEYCELQRKPTAERMIWAVEHRGPKKVTCPRVRPEHRAAVLDVCEKIRAMNRKTGPMNARRSP